MACARWTKRGRSRTAADPANCCASFRAEARKQLSSIRHPALDPGAGFTFLASPAVDLDNDHDAVYGVVLGEQAIMIRAIRWSSVAFHTKLLAVALLLSCGSVPAQQIYKWTDANGEVHYTDTPPPGAKAEPVHIEKNVIQEGKPASPASNRPRPGVPASSPAANQPPGAPASAPAAGRSTMTPEQAALRQRRIAECERNNGIDCAHQVDVQLRAEHLEPVSGPDGLAERRQRMIKRCQANNGMDCEHQVDLELDAERLQRQGGVIHDAR